MGAGNPQNARVRRALFTGKTVPEILSTLDTVCAAGAQSPEVQASPVAHEALIVLQQALGSTHGSLSTRQSLAQALMAAAKALRLDVAGLKRAVGTYESAVDAIAGGDAAVINKAGLLSRQAKPPPVTLGKVPALHSRPGTRTTEAILRWPRGPGATGYALEVSFTPQDPSAPWIALGTGARRTRVVKGPAPASQFLARVASVAGDGTLSEWTDPVLVTTL